MAGLIHGVVRYEVRVAPRKRDTPRESEKQHEQNTDKSSYFTKSPSALVPIELQTPRSIDCEMN